jgi:hypothetical protein
VRKAPCKKKQKEIESKDTTSEEKEIKDKILS